jgi:hypothetical protein
VNESDEKTPGQRERERERERHSKAPPWTVCPPVMIQGPSFTLSTQALAPPGAATRGRTAGTSVMESHTDSRTPTKDLAVFLSPMQHPGER